MSYSGTGDGERPPLSIGPEDWPVAAADKIVNVVGTIRSYTVDNLALAARALVYGLVAITACVVLTVMMIASTVRMADAYLPIGSGVGSATWAAYAFAGVLISILGLGAWRARSSDARPVRIAVAIDVVLISAVTLYGVIRAVL